MSIAIEAVYENGVLRPDHPLPLLEHQRVRVLVQEEKSIIDRFYGVIGWQGDSEVVDKVALEQEFGIAESP